MFCHGTEHRWMVVDSLLQNREMLLELALCIGRSDVKRSYKEFKSSKMGLPNFNVSCLIVHATEPLGMFHCAHDHRIVQIAHPSAHISMPTTTKSQADGDSNQVETGKSRSDLDLSARQLTSKTFFFLQRR